MSDKVSDERLVDALLSWLRKRGEPDNGIRYEAESHSNTRGVRHRLSHVELHGSDADFVAEHFHGQGARNLADALAARINSAIEPSAVADDGWIMHGGMVDPDLDGSTNVQVRFADGDTAYGAVHDWDQNWQWSPGDPFAAGMIVAYRPISASGRDGE